MSDIVAQAEKALGYEHVRIYGTDRLIRDLFAELKAAREEAERSQSIVDKINHALSIATIEIATNPDEQHRILSEFAVTVNRVVHGGHR